MDGRGQDDGRARGRRRRTAGSALVAMLVALALGALFNAAAMKRTALELPFDDPQRDERLALVSPLATVSHWLLLDRPARMAASALGRPDPGATPAVAATPRPKPTKHASQALKPLPRPYKGHPMHLYVAGDSMMGLPGMALVNLANRTHAVKSLLDYRISTGLCRPDFFDWPAQLRTQAAAFKPKAVALMFGANDRQGVQTASGKVYLFKSEGWEKEYRRRVRGVIGLLFDAGVRRIYWIGQPVMPDASFDKQMQVVNEIYRSEADKHPGVRYIDAHALLSDENGRYAQYLRDGDGVMQQVREADGEHMTYAGGLRIAEAVMAAIEKDWGEKKPAGAGGASPKATAAPAP